MVNMGSRSKKVMTGLAPYLAILLMVGLWQGATWMLSIPDWLLPSPVVVWNRTRAWSTALPFHIGITLFETLTGFLAALVIGVPLAMIIVSSETLRRALYPPLVMLQVVPKIAIAPLFLIWVGYGMTSKLLMAFLVAFFPIVVATAAGLETIPAELLDMSRVLKASTMQVFLGIRLPWALPHIFSGMKVAISLALIGAIIGEFVGSDTGLGYVIVAASGSMNTGLMFGAIVILALMGIVLFELIELLERWLCPWYVSSTSVVQAST